MGARLGAMNWAALSTAEPALADTVEQRFGAFTHHVLATLRKDGSPRTSGIEVRFLDGELWLGMMPDSLKALDLRRDPRFALQANPGAGTDMGGGDVRISGRAEASNDPRSGAAPDDGTETSASTRPTVTNAAQVRCGDLLKRMTFSLGEKGVERSLRHPPAIIP